MQVHRERRDDGSAVPPGVDPGQLDAAFPSDDLGDLVGRQHREMGEAAEPLVTSVLPASMSRGLVRGAGVGALVGAVAGVIVGFVLAAASFGDLATGWVVLITVAVGAAVGATSGAVYCAARSAEIVDERELARRDDPGRPS